jgi:cytochrome P450
LIDLNSNTQLTAPSRRVPPGPPEKYRTSEDLLQWMDRQFKLFGDTYKASVFGVDVYATRDVEFTHYVLVENWHNYVKGQWIGRVALLLGKGLMVSKGDLWRRQRKMIQPAFNQDSVATATELISSVNAKLLNKWQLAAGRNESVNVTRDVSSTALEVVLRFIFGEDYERVATHFDLLSADPARNPQFASSFRALGKIVLEIIAQRHTAPATSGGILDTLIQAREPHTGNSMPDGQLIDEVLTLIVAGHETTASTLNLCWYLLSQHPEVEEKLSNEFRTVQASTEPIEFGDLDKFAYTRQVLDETMRLYPAGWLLPRKALHDDQLGEYFVPAGTEIYISPYFIQRHPALWENPDCFDPDRFSPENSKDRHRLATIPFSVGPRNCIGALFARVEMQIHLITIVRHLRLRYIQSKPLELDAGVNLRSKNDFIMYPEARNYKPSHK